MTDDDILRLYLSGYTSGFFTGLAELVGPFHAEAVALDSTRRIMADPAARQTIIDTFRKPAPDRPTVVAHIRLLPEEPAT